MDSTGIESAIGQLSKLLNLPELTLPMKQKIQIFRLDLSFFQMFCYFLAKWNIADENMHLGSVQMNIEGTLEEAAGKGLYNAGYFAIIGRDFKLWDNLASNLLEKVEQFKPEIRETAAALFDLSSQLISSRADDILPFIDSILVNLKDLISLKGEMIVDPVKKQIEVLEKKLRFLRRFVDFVAKRCSKDDKMGDFIIHIQAWTKNCVCLSLLYWVDGMDEKMVPRMNEMLSDFMPHTQVVAEMYLDLLEVAEASPSDNLLTGEIVASFVDLLLENLLVSSENDFASFREGLVFLISFLVDQPKESARKAGSASSSEGDMVDSLVRSFIRSIYQTQDQSSQERTDLLFDFLEKIEKVMSEVRELYTYMPNSSESNFPRTNGIGFIDFLTENLSDMMQRKDNSNPFAEHKVMAVNEELLRFRSFLQDTVNLQNENEDVKALQKRITNLAYQVEHVIDSCSVMDIPVWNKIICFCDILEETKGIKTEMVKLKHKYNIGYHTAETPSKLVHLSRANTSKIDDIIVGFENEAKDIIDLLTHGSERLEMVSIVGMPGVGKTTLAKKVYDDPSIANFHKHAWCFVSQVYTKRDLLVSIIKSVGDAIDDAQISKWSNEDLAAKIRQFLLKQKYLVVMDDIWDIEAWNILKQSLPDDKNGSRIMFTSQNKNLILSVGLNSHSYPLSPLIEEKSWELLRGKLFQKEDCPPKLSEIGKQIVRYCEGLPLAITVIAGLLAKEKENEEWWKQVEASLSSDSSTKGYMRTIELSYKHLMDFLKPCFLYFGAFRKGEVISAHKLTLLWNAERFIKRTEIRSSEVEAKKYLMELIDRSLVIVSKRSSNGGVKACRVHDLLHKFCSEKAQDENFLHVVERSEDSHCDFSPIKCDEYRLCIHTEVETPGSKPSYPRVRYLLFFCDTIAGFVSFSYFDSFKLLKVLNLEKVYLNNPFPQEVLSMVHLRYLAIWGRIKEVPESIANLWKLETFIVKGTETFILLPEAIWEMKSLNHVDVNEMAVISLGDYEGKETNSLSNIETFSSLSLSHGGDVEKIFKRLKKLRKLRCRIVESMKHRRKGIQFPALASLENLESLKMSIDGSHEQVFYSWMRIQFQAFDFPSKLKKLTLYNLGLPWRAISTIGKLPHLEVLKLRQQAFRGQKWDVEDEQFLNLKFLELSGLDIVIWNASKDSFPCLEGLVMVDCYELEDVPSTFADIFSLKVIQLKRCNYDLEYSAHQILKEQQDMGNEELEVLILR